MNAHSGQNKTFTENAMNNMDAKAKPALGFLTVVQNPQYGLCGGYLVLNTSGRPLEFHCTAPIKPNRAQEILYGPTLESFLYGDQIGQTLIQQGKNPPLVVCTDREAALAAREYMSVPLVLVLPRGTEESLPDATSPEPRGAGMGGNMGGRAATDKIWRVDGPHGVRPGLTTFQLGKNRLALPDRAEDDRQTVTKCLASLADGFDLAEPFQRIREAIEEAQQAAERDEG
jgi:hypothetical protein